MSCKNDVDSEIWSIISKKKVIIIGFKGMGAGVITGTCDISALSLGWQRICKASGIVDVYR